MFDNNKLGEIRPNQLITTFGPGAIVDAVKDSVTILDLNYWKEKGKKIIDGRLASYLNVDCFYMPRTSYSGDIPATSLKKSFSFKNLRSSSRVMYAIMHLPVLRKIYGQSYFIITFPPGQENIRIYALWT